MQIEGAEDLRREDAVQLTPMHVAQQRILDHHGRMHHTREGRHGGIDPR